MILKKPYAFLIKNFKIIHIIIFCLGIYINSSFSNIAKFYKSYSSNNFYDYNIAKNYLPTLSFIAIIIIIMAFTTMIYLMKKKKKPFNLYLISIIYYIIIIIGMLIAYNNINTLYEATLTQKTSRLYQDIYFIIGLPHYYFLVMYLLRGIGFDIKKFNFNKDLEELDIKNEDNEEFEFVIGNENYLIKRKIHRIYREIIYYYKENSFFINIVGATALTIIVLVLFLNISSSLKKYHIGSTLNADKFIYKLNNAYVTSYDYKNNRIKNNKKYVILDMTLTNKGTFTLKEEDIYITYGKNERAIHKKNLADSFSDLGNVYTGDAIPNKATNYLFIYEIPSNISTNHLKLLTFKGYERVDGKTNYLYREYVFNAKKIDAKLSETKINPNGTYHLGTKLYGNSKIKLINIEIKDTYEYTYQNCSAEEVCETLTDIITPASSNTSKLLILDYELTVDPKSLLGYDYSSSSSILNKFSKISYSQNDETKIQELYGKTYDRLPNKIFYDISKKITNSQNLTYIIKTRENNYLYEI